MTVLCPRRGRNLVVSPLYEETGIIVAVCKAILKKSNSSGFHDERVSSYVEVVSFLLATYATDEVIARAVKYVESYKQAIGMASTEFAKTLYTKALRCGWCMTKRV